MMSSSASVFSADKDCSVDSKNLLLVLLSWPVKTGSTKGACFSPFFFIKYDNVCTCINFYLSVMIEYSLSKTSNGILVIRTIHWQISFFQACIQVFSHAHEHWSLFFHSCIISDLFFRYLSGQNSVFSVFVCLSTLQCTNITSPSVFKLCIL